jgi:arylamine N-acetyltransferase
MSQTLLSQLMSSISESTHLRDNLHPSTMASVFTSEQIAAFLNLIQLPAQYLPAKNPPLDLAFLSALHVHTISTIPYDNLSLHYSATHKFSIKPQDTYKKFVEWGRGRGGYCMENSIFFNHILRGLGFTAYTTGVRIRLRENGIPVGAFTGWSVPRPSVITRQSTV